MTITVTTADAAENLDRAGGRVLRLLIDADATGQRLSVLSCESVVVLDGERHVAGVVHLHDLWTLELF